MVQDIDTFVYWQVEIVLFPDFINVWLDSSIYIELVIVKEEWVLRIEHEPLRLVIISSLEVVIWTVEILWLEMVSLLLYPLWM